MSVSFITRALALVVALASNSPSGRFSSLEDTSVRSGYPPGNFTAPNRTCVWGKFSQCHRQSTAFHLGLNFTSPCGVPVAWVNDSFNGTTITTYKPPNSSKPPPGRLKFRPHQDEIDVAVAALDGAVEVRKNSFH